MKNNTKTTKKVAIENQDATATLADLKVNEDLKHAILIVSLVANLFILTAWITMQVTTQYDLQIASFLFSR